LLVNSNDVKGNICIFYRNNPTNEVSFGASAARVLNCQNSGAAGIIEIVGTNQFPFNINSTAVTVPFAYLTYGDGTNIVAYCTQTSNSPVVATFGGGDQVQTLGQYIGGRGAGTPTTFGVYAPQAGVYPMRLLFEQGGGDASVEWWTEDSFGRRALVNESSPTNGVVALKAYRARTVSGGAPHISSIVKSGANVNITWTGVGELHQAGSVTGPYFRTPGIQNNPQSLPATNTDVYFRVRQY